MRGDFNFDFVKLTQHGAITNLKLVKSWFILLIIILLEMRFLTKTITISIEIISLTLFIVWYRQHKEIEPLIGIIGSVGAFLTSIVLKISVRPRIVLHKRKTHWGRRPRGFTENNPPIIQVGVDHPNMYWELDWNFILEIRNNSSLTAYNISIVYKNLPPKTFVQGEIGKIEPLLSNELREFGVKIVQNVTGNHFDAERYMAENESILTQNFIITVKYMDESGLKFCTKYIWQSDLNKFSICWRNVRNKNDILR